MHKYKRLTYQDRELIGKLLLEKYNQTQIAALLGVHKSTISRELKRNRDNRLGYFFALAQYMSEQRRDKYLPKIERNPYLLKHIIDKLKEGWSPEQIAGRSRLKMHSSYWISHETIYAYIFSEKGKEQKLYSYLRSRRKRRFPKLARRKNKRSMIPNRVSIHDRPEAINSRKEFGHWEADLVVFSKDKRANIFTMRERKSRFFFALKNENRSPATINKTLLSDHHFSHLMQVKSITFDNDISFRNHEELADALGAKTYFCDPFKSHQKGAIENANRLLRQYCPRKIDIEALGQDKLTEYVRLINNRPMKCLGYKTPQEVHYQHALEFINNRT